MRNKLITIITIITFITIMAFIGAGSAHAVFLSIRLEEPKSPTNDNSFKINFVTLDADNRSTTVKCFKKGPADADFIQFGSDISLPSGGNSGDCVVDSSLMNSQGTYQFYTTAQADGDTATSSTVTVQYKNQAPGTPYNFSKERVGTCEYKIRFKTSADGLTQKVEIYMSSLTSFTADSGTKVGEVGIGSDQEGSFTKASPDCDKTFYFVIRAFDDAGNGSGLVGDSSTNVTIKEVEVAGPVIQQAAAIPAQELGVGGQILGAILDESKEGEIMDEEATPEAEEEIEEIPSAQPGPTILTGRNLLLLLIAIIVLGIVYLYRKSR